MTLDKYQETLTRLEEAGAAQPEGRIYHAASGDEDQIMIFDIWDSMESFERFGETLVPILEELGIGVDQPDIQSIQNVIEGIPVGVH
jgi:hypothetical protein